MKLDFSKLTGHLVLKATSIPDACSGRAQATPADWLSMIAALDARVELYCRGSGLPAPEAICSGQVISDTTIGLRSAIFRS